jgi:hypothetical protein
MSLQPGNTGPGYCSHDRSRDHRYDDRGGRAEDPDRTDEHEAEPDKEPGDHAEVLKPARRGEHA